MRKLMMLSTLLVLVFSLAACDLLSPIDTDLAYKVTVDSNIDEAEIDVTSDGDFLPGSSVTAKAEPLEGYDFEHWFDNDLNAVVSTDKTYTFYIHSHRDLTAFYTETDAVVDLYTVTLTSNQEAAVLSVTPSEPVEANTEVTVQAESLPGYTFDHWINVATQAVISQNLTATFTVTSNVTVKAVYTEIIVPEIYTITLDSNVDDAPLTIVPSDTVEAGTEVTIKADLIEGYTFQAWINSDTDVVLSADKDYTFFADADLNLLAYYNGTADPTTYTVTVDSNIVDAPLTILPESSVSEGTEVTITAGDVEGYTFNRWVDVDTGNNVSIQKAVTFILTTDRNFRAEYELTIKPAVYLETFEDFFSTGSQYRDFKQIGVNGIEWHFTHTRTDIRFDNISDAVTLRDIGSMEGTIPEGVRYLSIYYENAFSGSAGIKVYINDVLVGTGQEVQGTIGFLEITDLDVKGDFKLRILPTNAQTTLDDLYWENNVEGSDYPIISFDSFYWDAEFDASPSLRIEPGNDVTVTATDPEGLYDFVQWEDEDGNVLSEDNPYTFTIYEDVHLIAVFNNPPAYTLVLDSNYYLAALNMNVDRPVVEGTEVIISASDPKNDFVFVRWEDAEGNLVSEDATFTYTTTDTSMTLTAVFNVPDPIDYITMDLDQLLALELDQYDGYYSDFEGLYGDALRDGLQSMMLDLINYQSYGDARTILQESDRDPYNHDNIILVYTRLSVPGEWDGGSTWNREHVWPSLRFPGDRESNLGSDLHSLTPANPSENSSRGYKYFDWETTTYSYEPHDDVKGDVARMMFYMDIMYDALSLVDENPNADNYEMGSLIALLQWHILDEVSHFEMYRNDVIEEYQNNRNPFIDYPHFVYLIYYDHPEVGLDSD